LTASNTKVRLVTAMAALENLLANLEEADRPVMGPKRFEKVSEALRKALREELGAEMTPEVEKAVSGKLLDVNRRAFEQKLHLLLAQWRVPLEGISEQKIKTAVRARNAVVHRGHYWRATLRFLHPNWRVVSRRSVLFDANVADLARGARHSTDKG
jgi:hypothetical protein